MKKHLLLAAFAIVALAANAQVGTGKIVEDTDVMEYSYLYPREFAYENQVYFLLFDAENFYRHYHASPDVIKLYNDDLDYVRSFTIVHNPSYTTDYWQKKPLLTKSEEYARYERYRFAILDDLKAYIHQEGYAANGSGQYWPTEEYKYVWTEEFGMTLPGSYYVYTQDEDTNQYVLYQVYMRYWKSYSGEWEKVRTDTISQYEDIVTMNYYDLDNNTYRNGDVGFFVTQTLFNDEEKFEYIRIEYDDTPSTDYEQDRDEDGEVDYRVIENRTCVGFSIVQEDGTVIQTVPRATTGTENSTVLDRYADLIKVNGKMYLSMIEGEKTHRKQAFYRIDKQTNNVKRMNAVSGLRVSPRIAEKSQNVTVELEEGSQAQQVLVVNAAGQIVKKIPVANGQHRVTFNTATMGRGMNMVSDGQNSCKMIIK